MHGVSDDEFRTLALALRRTDEVVQPNVYSLFRVDHGPIFASLRQQSPARTAYVYNLDTDRMAALANEQPRVFKRKAAFLVVKLARVDLALLRDLLADAHTMTDPRPSRAKTAKPTKSTQTTKNAKR